MSTRRHRQPKSKPPAPEPLGGRPRGPLARLGAATVAREALAAAAAVATDHPRWIRLYVDGGTLGDPTAQLRKQRGGIYWSMRAEDPAAPGEPVLVRRQDSSGQYLTNNDAEWCALREALQYIVAQCAARPVVIHSDSALVVHQFNGDWRAKVARHHRLRDECRELATRCTFVVVRWVPRAVSVEKLGH